MPHKATKTTTCYVYLFIKMLAILESVSVKVKLYVGSGYLAPEWVGLGSAGSALSMDMDEICKLAS